MVGGAIVVGVQIVCPFENNPIVFLSLNESDALPARHQCIGIDIGVFSITEITNNYTASACFHHDKINIHTQKMLTLYQVLFVTIVLYQGQFSSVSLGLEFFESNYKKLRTARLFPVLCLYHFYTHPPSAVANHCQSQCIQSCNHLVITTLFVFRIRYCCLCRRCADHLVVTHLERNH